MKQINKLTNKLRMSQRLGILITLICIPIQNIFLILATLNTQGGYLLSAGMAYFFQTRLPDPPRLSPIGFCGQSTTFAKEVFL